MTPQREEALGHSDREIVITRVVNARRELVWDAWTSPEHVVKWFGPNGFTTTIEVMDVRPGGLWNHIMHGPDGVDYPNRSVYVEVVKPERLVYDHGGAKPGDPEVIFRATVTFEDIGGQTKITMRSLFPTQEDRDRVVNDYRAVEGGHQTLKRLDEFLTKN